MSTFGSESDSTVTLALQRLGLKRDDVVIKEFGGGRSDPENKQVMELMLIRQEAGRPFAAPPGAPADRVAALRQGFAETLADPGSAKTQLEIGPPAGQEIEKMPAKAYAAPKPIVQRAAALVEPAASHAK